jgi:tetratricopeptide (TPR) repeat protein
MKMLIMMKRTIRVAAGFIFLSAMIVTNINGQELNDVITVYNDGAKAIQTDPKAAITAFENVISLSAKVGESANDLKQKATQVLPGLYVKVAVNALNAKKPAAEVVKTAKAAMQAAEKYGSTSSMENGRKILTSGYYNMGIEFFTKKDYDNAILAFDSVLSVNPDYSAAIYNKALIYRTQNNSDAFEGTIDQYISKTNSANDTARSKQASKLALEYFRALGSQSNQSNNLEEALTLLNKAAKYGDDKDLFYYFADVYNKKKDFDKGEEYAKKGLDLETGDAEAKAKFYFQLGLAQSGKGNTEAACASFKNSLYGPFSEPSKAERKNLKCE